MNIKLDFPSHCQICGAFPLCVLGKLRLVHAHELPFCDGDDTVDDGVIDRRLELVGSCYDPGAVLATVGLRSPVDYTVVNGVVTIAEGQLVRVDEAKLAEDAQRKCSAYLAM